MRGEPQVRREGLHYYDCLMNFNDWRVETLSYQNAG